MIINSRIPEPDWSEPPVRRINRDGDETWHVGFYLHRLDGPAIIKQGGQYKAWWVYGRRHRIDGPALIDGSHKFWYVNDQHITKDVNLWLSRNRFKLPMSARARTLFALTFGGR